MASAEAVTTRGVEQPLSIAMIAPFPFPTHQGTQIFVEHIARALARKGHLLHLITYGHGEREVELPRNLMLHRAKTPDVGSRSGPHWLRPVADASLGWLARKVIKEHGCQVVHAHNAEGLMVGFSLKGTAPIVFHAHNSMGSELPSYFTKKPLRVGASWAGVVFDRALPRYADAVIAFDERQRELYESFGVQSTRLHVIPPGLDPDDMAKPPESVLRHVRALLGPGPWILYAGNPDRYQNLRLLRDAFGLVRAQRPEVGLVVATHHAPEAFGDLGTSVPGVRYWRHQDINELRALMHLADIGVSPRAISVGAPIKVLNYMAAGLPVVAVESGSAGLVSEDVGLTSAAEPKAFAQAILDQLDRVHHDATRRQLRKIFAPYDAYNQAPLYEEVYWDVLH